MDVRNIRRTDLDSRKDRRTECQFKSRHCHKNGCCSCNGVDSCCGKGQEECFSGLGGKAFVFIALSAVSTAASWLCYYYALKIGDASVVVPIDKLSILLSCCSQGYSLRKSSRRCLLRGLCLLSQVRCLRYFDYKEYTEKRNVGFTFRFLYKSLLFNVLLLYRSVLIAIVRLPIVLFVG